MNIRRHLLTATLLATASTGLLAQQTADTLRLSREECVAIALQESQTVKVADLEVKRMDYSKKEVLANFFPSIDFTGAYQRAIELQTLNMSMGGQSQQIKMGTDNNWNFSFAAAMPLINATLWKSIGLSDQQILASLESARASRLDLVNNVNKAYYALMLAIDSREVIRQNYELAKFQHEIYKKQFELGSASEYDVLRSSVQVTNVEPDLLQSDIAIKQCQLQLLLLMGLENKVVIMPNVDLSDMKREMYGYVIEGDRNLSGNTSLRTLDINKRLAEKNVTLQKMAWVPTLGVQYTMAWSAMSNGNPFDNQKFNPYSNVALALSVPIFSGGSKYQKLRQAKVQVKEIELQRETLVNSLNMQVDLALDNIKREAAQINSSEKGLQSADKALEIMKKSFEMGVATYVDLRDVEMAHTSASLSYLQSIYNFLVSSSELDTLLGKDDAIKTATPSSAKNSTTNSANQNSTTK